MATERSRARRIHPTPRSEAPWRKGFMENQATIRFTRDQLLSLYQSSEPPLFLASTEEFADVHLTEGTVPVLTAEQPFAHGLGEEINSRERQVKMPDWYPGTEGTTEVKPKETPLFSDPVPEPVQPVVIPKAVSKPVEPSKPLKIVLDPKAVVRNLPKDLETLSLKVQRDPVPEDVFEEKYSNIDVEMEKKLKYQEEEEEELPEWAGGAPSTISQPVFVKKVDPAPMPEQRLPKFSIQLLQSQIAKGDPFAKVIYEHGVPDHQGYACLTPYSLPLEKAWYYKDPQNQIQGPFTSIEMYSWNLVGYFSLQLQVAWRYPTEFIPLGQMAMDNKESPVVAGLFEKYAGEVTTQRPLNAKTVGEIEKNTKWGNAYAQHFPAFSSDPRSDPDPSAALKSMLGIKSDTKTTAWGLPSSQKPPAKSLVEIQREQREGLNRKR